MGMLLHPRENHPFLPDKTGPQGDLFQARRWHAWTHILIDRSNVILRESVCCKHFIYYLRLEVWSTMGPVSLVPVL